MKLTFPENLERPNGAAISDHWTGISQIWNEIGPPLRPSPVDLMYVESAVAEYVSGRKNVRGLVLGSTPELQGILREHYAKAIAVDRNRAMLERIWPGEASSRINANWITLPFADASFSIVLCDAGIVHFRFLGELVSFGRELRRVLTLGGIFVTRLLVSPHCAESPEEVAEDLLAGRIPNLNVLKVRLGMALQGSPEEGVRLSDVWDFVHALDSNMMRLAHRIGWLGDGFRAFLTYRNSPFRYHFITREAFESVMTSDCGMRLRSCNTPGYAMGERCPTLALEAAE